MPSKYSGTTRQKTLLECSEICLDAASHSWSNLNLLQLPLAAPSSGDDHERLKIRCMYGSRISTTSEAQKISKDFCLNLQSLSFF